MVRRLLRFLFPSALLLAVVVILVRRTMTMREELDTVVPSTDVWTPIREARVEPWVSPLDGMCPPTHPVKAKEASHIYHLPGMLNYERTKPDRCYAEEAAAEADGFIKAKR